VEWNLRGTSLAPLVESVRRNQAPAFLECLSKCRGCINGLGSSINCAVRNALILRPIRNQTPSKPIERLGLGISFDSDRQDLGAGSDVPGDRQIALNRDRNTPSASKFFFASGAPVASAHMGEIANRQEPVNSEQQALTENGRMRNRYWKSGIRTKYLLLALVNS
jgi:hypothetical protein